MVRCKFKVVQKIEQADGSAVIKMQPVCGGSPENEKFFRYTPGGEFNVSTVNTEAAQQLEEGKEYYIDISLAE
jgi:hypothetical protein